MTALARAMMTLAVHCLGESRRQWSAAMEAEFETVPEGESLRFAAGCLVATLREMPAREEGRFTLTSYALALVLMLPMAALQIGCALLDLPHLYPGERGLPGALLEGGAQLVFLRNIYQAAVPSFSLLLLLLGAAHLRIAWAMLERDWARVTRTGMLALTAAVTLVIFMSALFLDCSQALLQAAVLSIELAVVSVVARWHAQLFAAPLREQSG